MQTRLVIADPDPLFAAEISAELGLVKEIEIISCEHVWDGVESLVAADPPDLILFGPGWAKTRVLDGYKELRRQRPAPAAILVTAEYSTDLRRQAAEIGFTGVFGIPIDSTELLLCIRRIAAVGPPDRQDIPKVKGRFITVFSTKGGVGKTVIATNLAVALTAGSAARAIVVDLDLQFGDVGVMLKLLPKHTLHDLVGLKSVDLGQLRALLTDFNEQVSAFVAPLQPELADLITPDVVRPVFAWLRQAADYVIIDTPPCFNDNVLGVLDETDELYLVTTLDLPSLKNIKLCLRTLQLLGFPREKTRLILNRVDRNVGLSPADVEAVFEEKVLVRIANDPAVPIAVNKGIPVLLDAPKAPASTAIFKLGEIITAGPARPDDRKKVTAGVSA